MIDGTPEGIAFKPLTGTNLACPVAEGDSYWQIEKHED
jgi:hypothetical protein